MANSDQYDQRNASFELCLEIQVAVIPLARALDHCILCVHYTNLKYVIFIPWSKIGQIVVPEQ